MDRRDSLYLLVLAALLASCASTGSISEAELEAQHRMAVADSLEQSQAVVRATLAYAAIADTFPGTSVHRAAVRRAALLYSFPGNPLATDSASRTWFTRYEAVADSPDEKQIVRLHLGSMSRVRRMRDSLDRMRMAVDSLALVARRQAAESGTRARRIQELETELQRAANELKRLRDIDMAISRSRARNKP